MVRGASKAPIVAPELKYWLKSPIFFGKYSVVAFMAAGKLPASPIAKIIRANTNKVTLILTIFDTSSTTAMAWRAPRN